MPQRGKENIKDYNNTNHTEIFMGLLIWYVNKFLVEFYKLDTTFDYSYLKGILFHRTPNSFYI